MPISFRPLKALAPLFWASLIALTGPGFGQALANGHPREIYLNCLEGDALEISRGPALCALLQHRLSERSPDLRLHVGSAPLGHSELTLILTHSEPFMMRAHLRWQPADHPSQTGASVTAGSRDRALSSQQYPAFITALLRTTDAPFSLKP